jgi:hypothetical protein
MSQQKNYLYKVYDRSSTYVGTWNDVVSDFALSEAINNAGGEVQVTLARTADNFGEGTDVDFGFKVKIYVDDGDNANGTLIFTGFISNYIPTMGQSEKVEVTILGYGNELNDFIITTDLNTDQAQLTGSTDQEFTDVKVAQSFIPDVSGMDAIDLKLRVAGSQQVTVAIHTDVGGSPDTSPLPGYTVTREVSNTDYAAVRFTFGSQIQLNVGQTYWIVVTGPAAAGGTIDITTDSTNGYIYSYVNRYDLYTAQENFDKARNGLDSLSPSPASSGVWGLSRNAGFDPDFVNVYEAFLRFDTSVIPGSAEITAATLKVYQYNDPSITAYDLEAYIRDWTPPLSASAFFAATDLATATRLGSLSITPALSTGLKSFTNLGNNMINGINRGGYTNIAITPADCRTNNLPASSTTKYTAFGGGSDTNRSVLSVTYTSNPRIYAAYATGDPYADGAMKYWTGSAWTAVAGADLYFATYSSDNATTVPYLSEDPGAIMRDIMDKYIANGGTLTYDTSTIELTGTTVSYTFNTNTTMEGIQKCLELAPAGWYFYVDQANGVMHFHQKSGAVDRTFSLGKDIISISPKKTIENVVNQIFFTGGGDPPLFLKFQNTTSIGLYGYKTQRYVDERVTLEATAETIANAILEARNAPELQLQFEIADNNVALPGGYDIELITIGEVIGIRNTGGTNSSFWDVAVWDLFYWDYNIKDVATPLLQIVRLERRSQSVKIFCSTVPPDVSKRIEDINRNLQAAQTANNPTSPS